MQIDITAMPNSKRFSVSVKDGKVRISLKSSPENNKANIELIRELSKLLGTEVRIVSGFKSKRKRIQINMGEEEWQRFLGSKES